MLIVVGSTNEVKVQAVEEVVKDYAHFASANILSYATSSNVSEQPLSLEETIRGAKNRAVNTFKAHPECVYSFGIESGLLHAEGTHTGFFNACVCCVFDGKRYHIGLSTGFEVPPPILAYVIEHKMDLSQACCHSGITNNEHIGSAEGLIGILTKGRVNRKDYTKQSVMAALIQLENAHWYIRDC